MKSVMKIWYLTVLTGVIPVAAQPQEKQHLITLEECQAAAAENYPAAKRLSLLEEIRGYKIKNLSNNYLPQGGVSLKASYQSDVTALPVTIPGMTINPLSKDQYSATLNIEQVIWDGGLTSIAKKGVKSETELAVSQLESEMYSVKASVNELYFGILLSDRYFNDLQLIKDDLGRVLSKTETLAKEGLANKSDSDAIRAEIVALNQRETNLIYSKESLLKMLSLLTGINIGRDTKFAEPGATIPEGGSMRPEMKLFEAKENLLNIKKEQTNSLTLPKIGAFIQAGYGRPGLNMLKDEFAPFFITGVKVTWNLGSYYNRSNQLKIADREILEINSNRETFNLNIAMKAASQRAEIDKIINILKTDDNLIALREQLSKAAEVKLENGVISVSDYLSELNKLDIARGNRCRHSIELISSIYELKHTLNR